MTTKKRSKRKRSLLVSAALVASLGMMPQYSNASQEQDKTLKNNITPKCLTDNSINHKQSKVKMIDKIVSFNAKTDTITGFAAPEPTRGENAGYTWTTTNNGQIPVTIGDITYYTDIKSPEGIDYNFTWNSEIRKFIELGDTTVQGTGNYYINNSRPGDGGAIDITSGNRDLVTGIFIGNNAGGSGGGGAICNHNGQQTINEIIGDFIGNYTTARYGGAITNNRANINSITGDFIGNSANSTYYGGGAIFNYLGTIDSVTGKFINNYTTLNGGAIDNESNLNLITNSNFIGNKSDGKGGAIYSNNELHIIDSSFIGNSAADNGSAIYQNSGTLTITAENKDVEFTDNNNTGTVEGSGYGIYVNGELNLNANNNHKITINDSIYSTSKTVNLDNGTLALGEKAATNTLNTLNSANSSTIDLQNEHSGDVLKVNNLTTDTTGLKFNADFDGSNNDATANMDKLDITNASAGSKITLNNIKVVTDGEASSAQYLKGTLSNISVETSDTEDNTKIKSSTDDYTYTFTLADKGSLAVEREKTGVDLATAISDEELGGSSYTMRKDFTFSENAGALDGENRDFTIYGQNHTIDGNGKTGIEVLSGQTLTIEDVDSFQNFNKGITNNGGTVNISSNLTNNTGSNGSAIINRKGDVNITNSNLTNNTATGYGGAIYINTLNNNVLNDGVTNIKNSTISENDAYLGGAIFLHNGELNIKSSEFTNNTATYGGAMYTSISPSVKLNIEDTTFEGNTADEVGAIGVISKASIKNSTFKNNKATVTDSASDGGGALFLGAVSETDITGSDDKNTVFENNQSGTRGGAISTRTAANASNVDAKLDITNSTFKENSANTTGGAIDNYFYNSSTAEGSVYIANSTFESNTANNGGAIYNHGDKDKVGNIANIKIANSEFTGNTATTNGGAIYNEGTLSIINSTFSDNTANEISNDIHNTGNLSLSGSNTLNGGITGTGNVEITDGETFASNISQKLVEVYENAKLTSQNITTENGIKNNGTLVLTGDSNTNAITGNNGTTVIKGSLENSAIIDQAVEVEQDAELVSALENLGLTIKNDGTIVAIGDLDKEISGSGTTKVDSTMSMTSNASVAGSLDLNGGTLDLTNDGSVNEYNVGSLLNSTDTGKLNIDIDFTGENVNTDTINIKAGTNNSGIVTLNDINVIGNLSGFTAEILKGETSSITLAISDELKNEYYSATDWTNKSYTDEITQTADWDDTFGTTTWEERTVSTLDVVDNTKIKYDSSTETQNIHTENGETLALLNQATQFGSEERKFVTNDATNIHTVTENLGTTATGTITVQGAKETAGEITNISTIDMDGHSGFVVSNANTTLNMDSVKVENAINGNGGVINVSNKNTVNITNSEFSDNVGLTAATSSKGGVVYNEGGIVTIEDSTFTGNKARYGGALYNKKKLDTAKKETSIMNISNTVFGGDDAADGNSSTSQGGAIYNTGKLTIIDSVFKNNNSAANMNGGAISNEANSDLNISGSKTLFENNSSGNFGGAIYNTEKLVINDGAKFKSNVTTNGGGAVYNTGNAEINDTTFEGNHAKGTVGGGAVADANTGTLKIDNSTFINNTSEYEGGAIAARRSQSKTTTIKLDISNSTFKGNKAGVNQDGTASENASTHGYGGAIYNVANKGISDTNAVTISGSTFGGTEAGEGNSAVKGGAIYNGTDTVTATSRGVMNVENSTFINNTAEVSGGAISNTNVMNISDSTFIGNTANGIANDIDNTGEITLRGTNILEGGISGETGITNIEEGTTFVKNLSQKSVNISDNAKLTVNDGLTTGTGENEGVVNSAQNGLELQGGTLTGNVTGEGSTDITGNVEIARGSSIEQAISLALEKTLTANASDIKGDVKSSGLVVLDGGAVTFTITGGDVNIKDNVTSSADNLKVNTTTINEDKSLTLSNGNITTDITGLGLTKIDGDVVNKADINTSTEILSGSLDNTEGTLANVTITSGSLTSHADNISGIVENSGTYNVLGGVISNNITGSGTTNINGDTVVSALISGDIVVSDDVTLKYNPIHNRTRLLASPEPLSQKIVLNNKSSLDISGNVQETISNLFIGSGKKSNLMMDWGDVVATDNIEGKLDVTSIDMTNTNANSGEYTFATGINTENIAVSDNVKLITTPTSANTVKYISTGENAGNLVSSRNNLKTAVTTSQEGESAVYSMSKNEAAGTNEAAVLESGKLTVQGNGNSITGSGIIVGSANAGTAELSVKDANMKNIKGDALVVNGGNTVTILAENNDVEISKVSGNAITLYSDVNGTSTANIDAGSKKIKINDDIISDNSDNVVNFNSGEVEFNGLFDPAQGVIDGAKVTRGGQDDNIDWTISNGTLKYTKDSYLNRDNNTITFNGLATDTRVLDTRNRTATDFTIGSLTLNADADFYGDVNLAAEKMDNFRNTPVARTDGTLHVAGLNLITDATKKDTSILFTPDDWIGQGYVDYTGPAQLTAIAPIYKYNVAYDDDTGRFNFERFKSGTYNSYNPAVFAAPVAAQLGGYLTQLNSYNQAFSNMDSYMLMTSAQRTAMKFRNRYAASDGNLIFDPTISQYENSAGWFRPYTTFESVGLNGGPSVDNIAYGTFLGGESKLFDLGHGWDGMWGAYIGYNGSHQNYDTVGIYQNGGTLGLVGMVYKGNFFTGLTANVGANLAEASTMYGSDNFGMLMTGIASKTGYNFELGRGENKGRFIIQPNLLLSYSFVNTFDYTSKAGVKISNSPLHAIQIEPGIKFIANLNNGWQPYAGVSMVWNVLDETKFSANNVSLPGVSVDPYVRYGLGIRKSCGERFTGFFQTYITNGGRNGVGLQAGFRWAIGKDYSNQNQTRKSETTQIRPSKIILSSQPQI